MGTLRGSSGRFVKGKDLSRALRDEKNMEGRRDIANGASVLSGVQGH